MIVFCPSCHSPASVPPHAADRPMLLGCPLCSHRFECFDLGESLPEYSLIEAENPDPPHAVAAAGDSSIPIREAVAKTGSTAASLDLFGSSISRRRASRRRQPSAVWLVVQVVLGGASALPLAVAILWYASAYDPLGWAPTVSRYAPWIVPDGLRRRSGSFARFGSGEAVGELPDIGSTRPATPGFAESSPDAVSTREVIEPEFSIGSADELPAVADATQSVGDDNLKAAASSLAASSDTASAELFYTAFDDALRNRPAGDSGSLSDDLRAALEELRSVSALKPLLQLSDKRLKDLRPGDSVPYIDVAKIRGVLPPAAADEFTPLGDVSSADMDSSAVQLDASARMDAGGSPISIWGMADAEIIRVLPPGEERPAILAGWAERQEDGSITWRVVGAVELR